MTAVAREQSNPALRGWAFELGCFVEIDQAVRERRSVQVKVWGSGNNVESWPATPVSNFDPKEFKVPDVLDAWARPIAWNQGGYDAVLLTSAGDGKVPVFCCNLCASLSQQSTTRTHTLARPRRATRPENSARRHRRGRRGTHAEARRQASVVEQDRTA